MAACDATALLVVDAQNDIMAGTALREKTIANIADCVGRARAAGRVCPACRRTCRPVFARACPTFPD